MKCEKCGKTIRQMSLVMRGDASISYTLDRKGKMQVDKILDFQEIGDTDYYCPHCDFDLDSDFVNKFLREKR